MDVRCDCFSYAQPIRVCYPKRLGPPHVCLVCHELSSGGAAAGVLSYQDTPPVHPCRLFLDVLSRKVLVRQYPHPSFNQTAVHLSETTNL